MSGGKTVTSYKSSDIKERLLEFSNLMMLSCNGIEYHIDPFNENYFHIFCDGKEYDFHNIDDVMNDPAFDGKSINDIAEQIEVLDW